MSAIYMISDYGKLGKHDETLVFSQPDGTTTVLFPYKTEHLILMGEYFYKRRGNAITYKI